MKIIASDYDGTLNRGGISDRVRGAIERWRSAGNIFGIVTGRGIDNIRSAVNRDSFKSDFFVANNGSVIADAEGNILFCRVGDCSVTAAVCRFILDYGCSLACVNYPHGEVFVCASGSSSQLGQSVGIDSFTDESGFTQISTVCIDEKSSELLTRMLNESFGRSVSAFQNGVCIDIVPAGVDKAFGIRELLKIHALDADSVCTVGDNNNDLAMLEAFRSYAVENAIERVKNIADYTVRDISELIEREMKL